MEDEVATSGVEEAAALNRPTAARRTAPLSPHTRNLRSCRWDERREQVEGCFDLWPAEAEEAVAGRSAAAALEA
jgi:hypothetical protein